VINGLIIELSGIIVETPMLTVRETLSPEGNRTAVAAI
jgi:hypothetical protein